jgi:hypothetical protein
MCRCPNGALRSTTIPPTTLLTPEGDAWRSPGYGPADEVRTGAACADAPMGHCARQRSPRTMDVTSEGDARRGSGIVPADEASTASTDADARDFHEPLASRDFRCPRFPQVPPRGAGSAVTGPQTGAAPGKTLLLPLHSPLRVMHGEAPYCSGEECRHRHPRGALHPARLSSSHCQHY